MFAPALACRSCRSSGRAGDAIRNTQEQRDRRSVPRRRSRRVRGTCSDRACAHSSLLRRELARATARASTSATRAFEYCRNASFWPPVRADLEGIHVLRLFVPSLRCPTAVAARRPGRPGCMTRTWMSVPTPLCLRRDPEALRCRWLGILKRTVPKTDCPSNSGRARKGTGSCHLDGRPADARRRRRRTPRLIDHSLAAIRDLGRRDRASARCR